MLVSIYEEDLVKRKKQGRPKKELSRPTGRVTAYNDFMRENLNKVKNLPNKERMSEIAKLWFTFKTNNSNQVE